MSDLWMGVIIGFVSCGCILGISYKIKEFMDNYLLFERRKGILV